MPAVSTVKHCRSDKETQVGVLQIPTVFRDLLAKLAVAIHKRNTRSNRAGRRVHHTGLCHGDVSISSGTDLVPTRRPLSEITDFPTCTTKRLSKASRTGFACFAITSGHVCAPFLSSLTVVAGLIGNLTVLAIAIFVNTVSGDFCGRCFFTNTGSCILRLS